MHIAHDYTFANGIGTGARQNLTPPEKQVTMMMATVNASAFQLPDWLIEYEKTIANTNMNLNTDEDKMKVAIEVSRQSVLRKTGGPFGCAIFEVSEDGKSSKLFCLGSNLVTSANNCTLHGEMVAIQVGCARMNSFTFAKKSPSCSGNFELFTSCEPCAMCLGAILWSGVRRVVCGAGKADAESIGFAEGPVFQQSYKYMEDNGVKVVKGVLREEAASVLQLYQAQGNAIYNGK